MVWFHVSAHLVTHVRYLFIMFQLFMTHKLVTRPPFESSIKTIQSLIKTDCFDLVHFLNVGKAKYLTMPRTVVIKLMKLLS